MTRLDPVGLQLRASETKEFERRRAVARQISVQSDRSRVAWLLHITQQDLPATAAKHQRRPQSSWTPAADHHVEHAPAERQGPGHKIAEPWSSQ